MTINRRDFVRLAGTTGAVLLTAHNAKADTTGTLAENDMPLPDDGWRLWLDHNAAWQDDIIHLPGAFELSKLPINPPTGGWEALTAGDSIAVTLPATVEQHYWGTLGSRSYTLDEFTYADTDKLPQNGAYTGVSWWWRAIDIPAALKGRRLILTVRGARLRAEVFLNKKLVGYSILEELPFDCDLTDAAVPGGENVLAIRITNPGGRFDWVDGDTLTWGKVKIQRSHGFGGLDRGLVLSDHPMDMRIADLWVLNTPQKETVHAYIKVLCAGTPNLKAVQKALALSITGEKSQKRLEARGRLIGHTIDGNTITLRYAIKASKPAMWDLRNPALYRLTARLGGKNASVRAVRFGFRWFTSAGVGKDAMFTLNGRRIKLYSAISWGYWGLNGMWPTPDLAEKEVTQAKALGLNCLAFHRNTAKKDVLAAQDRLGLLRGIEPGGGKFALGKLPDGTRVDQHSVVMQPPESEADRFCQRYMWAKIVHTMRAFRSHPSLVHWTMQNENNGDFKDPTLVKVMAMMRAEDESRIILMNDGMSSAEYNAAQAWYEPYNPKLHRSDREKWGGWWGDHQGAGDQWYDRFYQAPDKFTYLNTSKRAIVQYGEMEGCAVPDNHTLMVADILQRGGKSYDLQDHKDILAAYQVFLDKWHFREAFPNAEALFLSIGRKSYASWQNYMENARIADAVDYAAISGWESTAIDNHSGIVDNLRNFKSDPALIRGSLLPVRPVAKQRALTIALGEPAVFDFYLLNDTGKTVGGRLTFTMTDPAGNKTVLATLPAPAMKSSQFSVLVKEGFATPALTSEGRYRFEFALSSAPGATQVRELWVTNAKLRPVAGKTLKVGVCGVWPSLREQLAKVPGIEVYDYGGVPLDVVIACGLTDDATPGQKLGGDEGITLDKKNKATPVPGNLRGDLIANVKAGMPLLLLPQEDGLADGVAKQLAAEGAFTYDGPVGRYRAPWMGNWYFVRQHPAFAGLPVGQAMDGFFQARGRLANGLMVDGPNVDVFVGYSRDHDRHVGAGTFSTKLGNGKILFHRVPDMAPPVQQRFLSNAIAWLCA